MCFDLCSKSALSDIISKTFYYCNAFWCPVLELFQQCMVFSQSKEKELSVTENIFFKISRYRVKTFATAIKNITAFHYLNLSSYLKLYLYDVKYYHFYYSESIISEQQPWLLVTTPDIKNQRSWLIFAINSC